MKRLSKLAAAAAVLITGAVAAGAPASANVPGAEEAIFQDPYAPSLTDADQDGVAEGVVSFERTDLNQIGCQPWDIVVKVMDPGTAGLYMLDAGGSPVSELVLGADQCDTLYPVDVYGTADGTGVMEAFMLDSSGTEFTNGDDYFYPPQNLSIPVFGTYPFTVTADVFNEESVLEAQRVSIAQSGAEISQLDINLGVNDSLVEVDAIKHSQDWVFPSTGAVDTSKAPVCSGNDLAIGVVGAQVANTGVAGVNISNVVLGANVVGRLPIPACDTELSFRYTALQAGTSTDSLRVWALPPGQGFSAAEAQTRYSVVATGVRNLTPPAAGVGGVDDGAVYIEGSVPTATAIGGETNPISWPRDGSARCTITGGSTAVGTHTASTTCTSFGGSTTVSETYQVIPDPATVTSLPDLDSVSDTTILLGDDVTASAGGFVPGESVDVHLYSSPVLLATVQADANGVASATVTIPANTAVGTHTLVFSSASGVALGTNIEVTDQPPVVPSDFGVGFDAPVDMGELNTIKAGRAVPIKFNVTQGGVEVVDPAALSINVASIPCAWVQGMATDAVEWSYAGGTELRYDTDKFIANVKLDGAKGDCLYVSASMNDGSGSVGAIFELK